MIEQYSSFLELEADCVAGVEGDLLAIGDRAVEFLAGVAGDSFRVNNRTVG